RSRTKETVAQRQKEEMMAMQGTVAHRGGQGSVSRVYCKGIRGRCPDHDMGQSTSLCRTMVRGMDGWSVPQKAREALSMGRPLKEKAMFRKKCQEIGSVF